MRHRHGCGLQLVRLGRLERSVNGAVNLTATGVLSPGSSTGTLSTGNLVIDDGVTYSWQTSDVTGSDLIDVNGTLDMGTAALTVNIRVLTGDIPERVDQSLLVDGRDAEGEPVVAVVSSNGALRVGTRCGDGWHWSGWQATAGYQLELQWRPGEAWLYDAGGLVASAVGVADGTILALVRAHSTRGGRL